MGQVATLPVWKRGATAAERPEELAGMAREHPERFDAFMLVWRGTEKDGGWTIRTHYHDPKNADDAPYIDKSIGLLELGKMKIYEDSTG